MKKKLSDKRQVARRELRVASLGVWVWSVVFLLMLVACDKKEAHEDTYTCPMHPTVVAQRPGVCPVCGMDLVRTARPGEEVKITEDLQALLESPGGSVVSQVKTLRVDFKTGSAELKATGVVTYDPRALHVVASRAAGRLEKVYITTPLQQVRHGEKIAVLYSPELATAAGELIYLTTRDAENTALIQSARRRLELLGLTVKQIDDVVRLQETAGTYTLYSAYDGYAVLSEPAATASAMPESNAGAMSDGASPTSPETPRDTRTWLREGSYVSAGQTLLTLARVDALRVELNLPGNYAPQLHVGDSLQLDIGRGAQVVTIDLVQPFFTEGEDLLKVRVNLKKKTSMPAVGQIVEATLRLKGAETFWVPRSAVIDLGLQTVVFVKQQGIFKPQKIHTGTTAGNWVEVISGLTSQDEIAAQAAYLVDSESFIQTSF